MDSNSSQDEAAVIGLIDSALHEAIARGASDLHFEPYEDAYRIRLRIDGVLGEWQRAPLHLNLRIAARLKVMAGLDIANKQAPQDGRIREEIAGRVIDLRVSTLPTLSGEKVVLRILDGGSARLTIEQLGCTPAQQALLLDALHRPQGMVLVTGPTGSGKTVTLYAALDRLNDATRNLSTVEDPVEIRLSGVNQVAHNPRRGMAFATALRAFLRQDPDVIMVGEIRDPDTAEIAIKAAQTGHLVLSTLHTNDAPQTIARLLHMGIAPYNLTSSVTLVVAQRLLRVLCPACKRAVDVSANQAQAAGLGDVELTIFEPVGCASCHAGYRGRSGIYQMMPMTAEIAEIVLAGGHSMQIAEAAARAGVRSLRESALLKVREGVTSLAEAHRVSLQ